MANVDIFEAQSTMRRHTPGRVLFEGYISKLGGNKDDPYNLTKGTWSKRCVGGCARCGRGQAAGVGRHLLLQL